MRVNIRPILQQPNESIVSNIVTHVLFNRPNQPQMRQSMSVCTWVLEVARPVLEYCWLAAMKDHTPYSSCAEVPSVWQCRSNARQQNLCDSALLE